MSVGGLVIYALSNSKVRYVKAIVYFHQLLCRKFIWKFAVLKFRGRTGKNWKKLVLSQGLVGFETRRNKTLKFKKVLITSNF